jgi:hypothetical protein
VKEFRRRKCLDVRDKTNVDGFHVCDGLMRLIFTCCFLHFSLSQPGRHVYTARLLTRLSKFIVALARLPERFIVCKDIEPFTFRFERLQIFEDFIFCFCDIFSSGPWDLFHCQERRFLRYLTLGR